MLHNSQAAGPVRGKGFVGKRIEFAGAGGGADFRIWLEV
jgi:hypothetical protein